MTIKANLTKEEYNDLKWCLGEYIRICREQSVRERIDQARHRNAQSLFKKLVEDQKI